jgi:tetratricopeptide (TPR) repeat protein
MDWLFRAQSGLNARRHRQAASGRESIRYDAFISYSHAKDRPIAKALQSAMQRLGKPWYRLRALRVFRDDASLTANPDLWGSIEAALRSARYFVLLASPNAASSPWVTREVAFWLEHKSPSTLFIGLTESPLESPVWPGGIPVPSNLAGIFTSEPRWVDLRRFRTDASTGDRGFMSLAADFSAAIHGMPKEDLLSEEVRQQRAALSLAVGAAVALFVIAAVAIAERNRAENTLAAATVSANKLVGDVAVKLRGTIGIPIDVVKALLAQVINLQDDLVRYNKDDPALRRSRAVALRESSQTLLIQGDNEAALRDAMLAREIIDELQRDYPASKEIKRDRTLTLNRIGEALSSAGLREEALDQFQQSLAIREELAANTRDVEPQRDLALSYERVGDELFTLDRLREALAAYNSSLAIRKTLAQDHPDKPELQADLAIGYDRLARMQGVNEAALALYRQSLDLRLKVVAAKPREADWQRALASNHDDIAKILLATGRRAEAIASFHEALRIREELVAANPEIAQWHALHALSLYFLANAGEQPRERYTLALQMLRRLAVDGRLPRNFRDLPEDIEARLKELPE